MIAAAPVTAIVNARIGDTPGYTVVLVKGKISLLGTNIPSRALKQQLKVQRIVDAKGGRLSAGRVDVWASLGDAVPAGSALDAFDPYDQDAIREALSRGVTTVFLNPMRSAQSSGQGAVLKLAPGAGLEGMLIKEGVAIHAGLGLGGGLLRSLSEGDALSKVLEQAQAYQDSWIDYEEELEKYTKALATYAKQAAKSKVEEAQSKAGAARGRRGAPAPKGPQPKGAAAPAPKKPSAPKRPKQPATDPGLALMGKVLERELPLRIEAHRVEDIIKTLELQKTYGFQLILEGASEAHLLAEVLAERKVPVVLGNPLLPEDQARYPLRRAPDLAARLEAAGVRVVIGSDGWAKSASLADLAALHAQAGLDPEVAEAAITTRAAELLGLEKIGALARGYEADLVLHSPPELGLERIEAVFVDGRLVYQRSQQ